MPPKSKVLIVTLGSETQNEGGSQEYHKENSITSKLSPDATTLLLRTRARALNWLKSEKEATWNAR